LGDLLLVALFLGIVLWVGWPVTLWGVCAGVVSLGARFAAKRATNAGWAMPIADVLTGIAIGVAVVWLVQVVLTGVGGLAGAGTVRSTETWIAASYAAGVRFTHPAVLVAAIALALLVWSRQAPAAAWVLAAMGSALVFGGLAVRAAEVRWVASRRIEASSDLRSLRAAQTRLVAIAEVRQRLGRLSDRDRSYLATFFRATESKKHRSEIVVEKAERLAAQTGEPEVPPAKLAATAEWAAVERSEAWLKAPDAGGSDLSPSLDDLDMLARTARDLGDREAEARASMDALAGAVVDATATKWTRQAWKDAVRDLPSAERIVASDAGGGGAWDVTTAVDATKRSAVTEVDASERDFEASERGRVDRDWSDWAGSAVGPRAEGTPGSE